LIDEAPYIYQDIAGQRIAVAGAFELVDSDTYAFTLSGDYDPNAELVIDPDLSWSTYMGGAGADAGYGIAVDGSGGVYVTGSTDSSGWAAGGGDPGHNGATDIFVAKLTFYGDHVWSTYMGGSGIDFGQGIAVDPSGASYVTGTTESDGWVSGGFDTTYGGASDVFVAKLTPAGAHAWSTYVGGDEADAGLAIAVDILGGSYVTGWTESAGWTSGGYDTEHGGLQDGFVLRVAPNGGYSWSTYLGGNVGDGGWGIALDSLGGVYVAGRTYSAGWTSGGADTSFNGMAGTLDGFVVKLTSLGAHTWSTYMGGNNNDYGEAIAVAGTSAVYVTGITFSTDNWPSGGYDTTYNDDGSEGDAFVVKLEPGGAHTWSTYMGGGGRDHGRGIVVDPAGGAFVAGDTASSGWVSGGYDTTRNGGDEAFVVKLAGNGDHGWSTYLGGSSHDSAQAIALDSFGGIYVAGSTESAGWGSGGFDTTYGGSGDAFVAKLGGVVPSIIPDPGLEQAVRDELGIHARPLVPADLLLLTSLDASSRGVLVLTGLDGATNLVDLKLDHNEIVDISPLAPLTNLVRLNLDWNKVAHIGPVSGLTNLTELYLMENAFLDVLSLTGLTALTALNLGANFISNIAPLAGLVNLDDLWLHDNAIRDISPLANLTGLGELSLGHNLIGDISPLAPLVALTDLELQSNRITDLSSLGGLVNLSDRLDVSDNYLYLGPGSPALAVIAGAQGRGATVSYLVQREPGDEMGLAYDMGSFSDDGVTLLASQHIGDGPNGAADVDLYKVALGEDGTLVMDVDTPEGGLVLDSYLRVFSAPGAQATNTWDREADWNFGGGPNPALDGSGNPAYRYVWSTGRGLNNPVAADRWYAKNGALMVWDPNWAGGPKSVWAAGNDTPPNIRWDLMTCMTTGDATSTNRPMVQWQSPPGSDWAVTVTGDLSIQWFGTYTSDPLVDVVIARIGQGAGVIEELATWSVRRSDATPLPSPSTGWSLDISGIATDTIFVSPTDRIVWSLRSRVANLGGGTSVRMIDNLVVSGSPIQEIASNNDHDGLDPYLSLDLSAGTYYVGVSDSLNAGYSPATGVGAAAGGTAGNYELRIAPPSIAPPTLTWDGADPADWTDAHWNPGPIALVGGEAVVIDSGTVNVSADLTATPAASLDIASAAAGGTVNINTASRLLVTGDVNVGVGGTLNLDGVLAASAVNVNGGLLTNSRGSTSVIAIEADVTLGGGSTLVVDLLGAGIDTLAAIGDVVIEPNASLEIEILGGGDEFQAGTYTLIDADGGLTGTFANVTVLGAYATVNGNGLTYDYPAGTVTLTLDKNLNPADANLDGRTDVSDRIVWNNNNFTFGTVFATGDWNNDGRTDVSDRIIWNNNNFTFASATPPPQNAPAAGDLDEATAAGSFALSTARAAPAVQDARDADAAKDDADVAPARSVSTDASTAAPALQWPPPASSPPPAIADDGAPSESQLEPDLSSPLTDPLEPDLSSPLTDPLQ